MTEKAGFSLAKTKCGTVVLQWQSNCKINELRNFGKKATFLTVLFTQLYLNKAWIGTKKGTTKPSGVCRTSGFDPRTRLFILTALYTGGYVAGPLNSYVVNLIFRYNYAHFSHSSLCRCVSSQLSLWLHMKSCSYGWGPNFSFNNFHRHNVPVGSALSMQPAGFKELLTRSELTCQGYCVCLTFSVHYRVCKVVAVIMCFCNIC